MPTAATLSQIHAAVLTIVRDPGIWRPSPKRSVCKILTAPARRAPTTGHRALIEAGPISITAQRLGIHLGPPQLPLGILATEQSPAPCTVE